MADVGIPLLHGLLPDLQPRLSTVQGRSESVLTELSRPFDDAEVVLLGAGLAGPVGIGVLQPQFHQEFVGLVPGQDGV